MAVDEILTKANDLFKDSNIKDRIRNAYEVLLDARVIATSSDILLNVAEGIDCTMETYDPDIFARKIVCIYKFVLTLSYTFTNFSVQSFYWKTPTRGRKVQKN